MPVESNVLFAPIESGGRHGHLLFVRDGALLAQAFDSERLQTSSDAFPVVENISGNRQLTSGSVIRDYHFSVSASSGTLIYWTGGPQKEQLAWFDRSGKQLETVGPASQMSGVALAPNGRHIAAGMGEPENKGVWLLDGARGTSSRLTLEGGYNFYPIFSPDGLRVAYSSDRAGGSSIYQKSANGSGAEEKLLVETKGRVFLSDWSRDGRFLTYAVLGPDIKRDLWVLPLEGNRKPFRLLKTVANVGSAHFSPDGKWVAYQSDESGKIQVYVQPFPPGEGASGKWQISVDGGVGARWRGDGNSFRITAGVPAGRSFQFGSVFKTPASVSEMVSPTNVTRPVSISNRTTPNDQMSARLSTAVPRACSGLM